MVTSCPDNTLLRSLNLLSLETAGLELQRLAVFVDDALGIFGNAVLSYYPIVGQIGLKF